MNTSIKLHYCWGKFMYIITHISYSLCSVRIRFKFLADKCKIFAAHFVKHTSVPRAIVAAAGKEQINAIPPVIPLFKRNLCNKVFTADDIEDIVVMSFTPSGICRNGWGCKCIGINICFCCVAGIAQFGSNQIGDRHSTAVLALLFLMGCQAKPATDDTDSDVSIVEWEHSDIYTDADIQAAMDTVMTYFETEFKGCTLTQLCYPGDASADLFTEWAEECEADEAIVLYSSFDTDASGGDGSLEPNTTYDDFQWILVRDNGGTWEVKTYGYG